jgi:hypothetical protein
LNIRVSDPSFAGELFHFLRGKGCVVAFVSENTLSVQLPEARRTDAAALELELYLRVWETLHPDAPAEVVP